jgi:glyoxylase-like metal-dependent hydrolase (beta-lactamase superfamily II)
MIIPVNRYLHLVQSKQISFPYCVCVLIEGPERVLIDSGCTPQMAAELRAKGIDIVINTHFHWDHTRENQNLGPVQVWCHSLDAPAIRSAENFMGRYGFKDFGAEDMGQIFLKHHGISDRPVHRELQDGEILDFGKLSLRVIHTPGHTPGHSVLFDEDNRILLSGDIDLTAWGPWYLHICSDLDDYINSIEKCMELKPRLVISGHKGIMDQNLEARFLAYRDCILRKEEQILASLDQPRSLKDLGALRLFYGVQNQFDDYIQFWERQGVYLHLQRLKKQGLVKEEDKLYFRT